MNAEKYRALIGKILITIPRKHWQGHVNELTEDSHFSWEFLQWFRIHDSSKYYTMEQLKDWCIEESLTLDAMIESLASDIILEQLEVEFDRAATIYKLGRADA